MAKEETNKPKGILDSISSFSLILSMVVLMIIGAALIPLLRFAYQPTPPENKRIYVMFSMQGASQEVIEQEVTSVIEGAMSSINGVKRTSSVSFPNSGQVEVELKDGVKKSTVRFEMMSVLKQLKDRMPESVKHISLSGSGNQQGQKQSEIRLLSYTIHANKETDNIVHFVNEHIKPSIVELEYVRKVEVGGYTRNYLDVTVNPIILRQMGLQFNVIPQGINNYLGNSDLVGSVERTTETGGRERISLLLEMEKRGVDIGKAPIGEVNGRIITLDEVASLESKKSNNSSYYRINGQNTINLNISVDSDVNIIKASAEVRKRMDQLLKNLDSDYTMTLTNDAAEEVSREVNKLLRRIGLSLMILLSFVWLVSRSWNYVSVISITLLANVLISIICYYLFKVELNLVSLAGIAVSFGISIDTAIVMVDHYSYYRNRKAFLAILAALLTTIGSLVIIFFMPDYVKSTLSHFALIIIINLSISLVISLLFVPALIERCHLTSKLVRKEGDRLRRVYRWEQWYMKYIRFVQKKRWVYILLFVFIFGLPIHLLPPRIGQAHYHQPDEEPSEPAWYETLYNGTIGSDVYQNVIREPLETLTGGTLRLFSTMQSSRMFSRRERSRSLYIRASLTDGEDTELMNRKIMMIEHLLSPYEEIKRYVSHVSSRSGNIIVEFKEDLEDKQFPAKLEQRVIDEMLKIGGAEWSTSGISRKGFSTGMSLEQKEHRIGLAGFNYADLYRHAEKLAERIKKNVRASNVSIELGEGGYGGFSEVEYFLDYDKEKMAAMDIDLSQCYASLSNLLSDSRAKSYRDSIYSFDIVCHSSERDNFDMWHFRNSYLPVGDRQIRICHLGNIGSRSSQRMIIKNNQEYVLQVAFNFNGTHELADRYIKRLTQELNYNLPVGYRTYNRSVGYYEDTGSQYWLILLIVVIIFFICSVLFESLWQPLVIILLIPISYIGTFLTFYFTGVNFGTGGFASLVLLSGLVVNAAIYIVNDYNGMDRKVIGGQPNKHVLQLYVKAFDHKIVSICLTVLSTVLGLIPFLLDGPQEEEFWYSFAVGTMGGLLFSLVSLSFCLPILIPFNKIKRHREEIE